MADELFSYERLTRINNAIPADTLHPEGQKFRVGDLVQIVNPQSWFAKRDVGQFFTVDYSYWQQYGWMSDAEKHKREYSLTNCATGISSAWFDEEELALA